MTKLYRSGSYVYTPCLVLETRGNVSYIHDLHTNARDWICNTQITESKPFNCYVTEVVEPLDIDCLVTDYVEVTRIERKAG